MKKLLTLSLIGLLFLALAAIRYFQNILFYDPLINFFSGSYLYSETLPQLDLLKILLFTTFRFWLNTLVSTAILILLFRKSKMLKIIFLIYSVLFVVLITAYTLLLLNYSETFELALFYVRRFLIQPVLLLLLVPAFYYQKLRDN